MYSLYALYEYGISLNQIKNLVNQNFTLNDFILQTDKVRNINEKKPKLHKDIMSVLSNLNPEKINNSIVQLAHEGLSKVIIDNLINLNITYQDIESLTIEQFNEINKANKPSVFLKIQEAYESLELKKGNTPYTLIIKNIQDILAALSSKESITVEEILKQLPYPLEKEILKSIIQDFEQNKYIKCDNQGKIKRSYPNLENYMKEDFINKEIFIAFLEGTPAIDLAGIYDYSRQGIYNILKRTVDKMPLFEEDIKYADIYKKFDIDKELFCELFNEQEQVFIYLDLAFTKGKKLLLEEIYNSRFTESQRRIILRHYDCFIKNGEIKAISKMNIFEEVILNYALNPVRDQDIVDKFNEYITKHNFSISLMSDETSIRGLSNRCKNLIRGNSNTYRYYDFEIVTPDVLKTLSSLLKLEPGVYSMKKIFKENLSLMEEIDIRTEFELHNLYKQLISLEQVKYTRMPEFVIGNITKKMFLLRLFKEYSPIHIDELLEFTEEIWGIRADSTRSYIFSNLREYVHEDIIKTDYKLLSEQDIQKISTWLIEPLYTVEEIIKIGNSVNSEFEEHFLNNMTLSKLGYTLRSNLVLRKDYNNIDKYFKNLVLSKDYFHNEHLPIYGTQSFNSVIYQLEKNHDIFKIEKDLYITYSKLTQANMSKLDIISYKEALLSFVSKEQYFTLFSLHRNGFEHHLDDLGFTDDFYNRLIWTFEEIRTIQTSEGYIFKITNEGLSLKEFLFSLILKYRKIDIYEFLDDIKNTYGITLEKQKVLYLLNGTSIYYSSEIYRLYADKDDYYEEVYD